MWTAQQGCGGAKWGAQAPEHTQLASRGLQGLKPRRGLQNARALEPGAETSHHACAGPGGPCRAHPPSLLTGPPSLSTRVRATWLRVEVGLREDGEGGWRRVVRAGSLDRLPVPEEVREPCGSAHTLGQGSRPQKGLLVRPGARVSGGRFLSFLGQESLLNLAHSCRHLFTRNTALLGACGLGVCGPRCPQTPWALGP